MNLEDYDIIGYHYTNENDIAMVEYHINDHESFLALGASLHPFGGKLFVCFPRNQLPLILIGQDKCIMKQNTFTHSS